MIILIKLIAITLGLLSITKSYLDYRKRQEPLLMFLFWSALWLLAVAVVVYPPLIDTLILRTADQTLTVGSIMSLAFIFMLYIVYRVYTKAARIEYQQAQLVRKLGLSRELNTKSSK